MNAIFMNSKNRKASDSHRLLFNYSDKTGMINMWFYQILVYITHEKI